MTKKQFYIELLDKTFNRKGFDCGNDDLNRFLTHFARQNQDNNISKTYAASVKGSFAQKPIIGFYTLASGQVTRAELPKSLKHPNYPVSIARIARLAVDRSFQGNGLGSFLLHDALKKIKTAADVIGIYAIVVDAKDQIAKNFYMHFGFQTFQDSELTLFMPMTTITKLHQKIETPPDETNYLLSSEANTNHLKKSLKHLKAGKIIEKDLQQ